MAAALLVSAGVASARDDWKSEHRELAKRLAGTRSVIPAGLMHDRHALLWKSDRDPLDVILRRTTALLGRIRSLPGAPDPRSAAEELAAIRARSRTNDRTKLFAEVHALRRRIALANPLLNFTRLLVLVGSSSRSGHMCDQYFGFHQRRGSSICLVSDVFGPEPRAVDLLSDVVVREGRYEGRTLAGGAFHSMDLSFDGQRIVFAWAPPRAKDQSATAGKSRSAPRGRQVTRLDQGLWDKDVSLHLFCADLVADAAAPGGARVTDLVQLTDGVDDDFSPCWLPDGERVVFISTRRGGYGRCHGGRIVPTFTLHSISAAGGRASSRTPRCISFHETNEWNPSVTNDGRILYTRWDYVDRDSDIAHHPWLCDPDGCDPRAFHGNYPLPWSTLGEQWKRGYPKAVADRWTTYDKIDKQARTRTGLLDGRCMRPWGEWHLRAIPGSTKFVGIASSHHGRHTGTVIVIDPDIEDDNVQSQLRRVTEHFFPEAETRGARDAVAFALNLYAERPVEADKLHFRSAGMSHPWPLSEDFFLVGHRGRVVLLDRFGNELRLCKGDWPIPLRRRPRPPRLAKRAAERPDRPAAERKTPHNPKAGNDPLATLSVMNIYDGDLPWPKDTRIKWMRIVQVVPQSAVPGRAPLVRMPLGAVPVEDDGSVYCEAPVGRLIYFQALDEYGMAVQSMRSGTFVHPGEQLICQGCHEHKWRAPARPKAPPLALRRAPSRLVPEVRTGAVPFNAQVLLDGLKNKCNDCHAKNKARKVSFGGRNRFQFATTGNGAIMSAARGGSRTIPGHFGARATPIGPALRKKVHQESLTQEEIRRVVLWLDCNSMSYGVYTSEGIALQRKGERAWPLLDVSPADPLGLRRLPEK